MRPHVCAGACAAVFVADGVLYGKRVKDLRELADNDELAAEEAAAQGGVPGERRPTSCV